MLALSASNADGAMHVMVSEFYTTEHHLCRHLHVVTLGQIHLPLCGNHWLKSTAGLYFVFLSTGRRDGVTQ